MLRHHRGLPRRAAHRLPEPAAHLRPPHRAARAAVRAGGRGPTSASARTARCVRPLDEDAAAARRCAAPARRAAAACAIVLHARLPLPATTSRPSPSWRASAGFTQVSVLARGQPADEARRRAATPPWSTPTSRRSCAATSTRSPRELARRAADVHAVERRLTDAHRFQGKDAILSGPGRRRRRRGAHRRGGAGHDRIIGFDMGGTSTDVSHYAGEFERAFETRGRRACACARR